MSQAEFWNQRYSGQEYAYGKKPNVFVEQYLANLKPGRALFAAEGEGRNAVYAASLGWTVSAFDISESGLEKGRALADERNVSVEWQKADFFQFQSEQRFDLLVLCFAHLPKEIRQPSYRRMLTFLNPAAHIIVVGYSKQQLGRSSGGPKEESMLYSEEQLRDDFDGLIHLQIEEKEVILNEGNWHQGAAAVICMQAEMPSLV